MHFPCEATVLCPDSVNGEVFSKPVLWICPRVDRAWSLIAARAGSHVPSWTRVRAVPVGDSPATQGSKPGGAWGGQGQGDPARSPRGPARPPKVTVVFPHELSHPCFIVQLIGRGRLATRELLPCVYGQQQLRCATIACFCLKDRSAHTLTRPCWSLALGSWPQGTVAAEVQPSRERAEAHKLVGRGWSPGSSQTAVPESGTSSPNGCSRGSRFCAGCFPKHKQLEHFCYVSLHEWIQ